MNSADGRHPENGEKLLIIHPGALGDVVAVFGIISDLKRRFRQVTLVCQTHVGRLAGALNLVDQHMPLEAAYWASLYLPQPDKRILQLLGEHHSIIVFSVGGEWTARLERFSPAPCLQVPARPPAKTRVPVARFAAEKLIAGGLLDKSPSPRTAACCPSGGTVSMPPGRKTPAVLLHPGAGSPRKRWPIENFASLADLLRAHGIFAGVVIGPAERDLLAAPHPALPKVHVLNDILDLLKLLQSAEGFIGNDSGVAHLAACLGLITTVIFTASDPLRWNPNGPAVAALAPALPCQPCFEIEPENCPPSDCARAVGPETVWRAFDDLCRKHGMM